MRRLLSVVLAGLFWGYLGIGQAQAIPIVYGKGDALTHLDTLSGNLPALQGIPPADRPTKIGFMYWHFHIFWATLWTSDGEFVAYNGDEKRWSYIKLGKDPKEAAGMLGLDPAKFSVPLFYRFPLGWWIIGGFIVFCAVSARFKKETPPTPATPATLEIDPTSTTYLWSDPRYQQALKEMGVGRKPLESLTAEDIQRGIDVLIVHEVPRQQAEDNLARLLEEIRPQEAAQPDKASE